MRNENGYTNPITIIFVGMVILGMLLIATEADAKLVTIEEIERRNNLHLKKMVKKHCGWHTHGDLDSREFHNRFSDYDGKWEMLKDFTKHKKTKTRKTKLSLWEIDNGRNYFVEIQEKRTDLADTVREHDHCPVVMNSHANASDYHRVEGRWRLYRIK